MQQRLDKVEYEARDARTRVDDAEQEIDKNDQEIVELKNKLASIKKKLNESSRLESKMREQKEIIGDMANVIAELSMKNVRIDKFIKALGINF